MFRCSERAERAMPSRPLRHDPCGEAQGQTRRTQEAEADVGGKGRRGGCCDGHLGPLEVTSREKGQQ